MLLVYIVRMAGWLFARMPERMARAIAIIVGDLIYFLPTSRRYVGLSNLHHAFPERGREWQRRTCRTSCRRLVELAMFLFASPHFDDKRLATTLHLPEDQKDNFRSVNELEQGVLLVSPHLSGFEAGSFLPHLLPGLKGLNGVYRPFDHKHLDAWVRETRVRHGARLFSRKDGLTKVLKTLRNGEALGILFDQNAGSTGAMIMLFGRAASATDFPGILVQRFKSPVLMFHTVRRKFWSYDAYLQPLQCEPTAEDVTLATNAWLERLLTENDDICADWFWTHRRWKTHSKYFSRLGLHPKKNYIPRQMELRGWTKIPKGTRFWIRLPNWLGDVLMALPLIRAIRAGRPDAEVTLLCQPALAPLLKELDACDRVIKLPRKGRGYYRHFWRLRHEYPDTTILFTNSLRGDLEARLTRVPQRFGMVRPGKRRPLLTHPWRLPEDLDETRVHQTEVWLRMLRNYGLKEELDRTPFALEADGEMPPRCVGMICGTENNPQKRWPVQRWRELAERLLEDSGKTLVLFGTARDAGITAKVAEGLPADRVLNLAGKTGMVEFAAKLRACDFIVCNDTGGMHMANALGVPLVAVFGPTNPVRTGPAYDAPFIVVQPEGCPETGGSPIEQVTADQIVTAVDQLRARSAAPAQALED